MTETEETGDLLEEPEVEGESLVATLSRRVGGLARTASDSLRSVSAAFAARPPAEQGSPQLAADLEELGALVASYRERGYAALEQDDSFWKLIARIGGAMPRKRAKRLAAGQEAATKLRKRGRVRKRVPDGAKPQRAPRAGEGASPPAAETLPAAATDSPPASGKPESEPPASGKPESAPPAAAAESPPAAEETNTETAAEAEAPPADGDDKGPKTSE